MVLRATIVWIAGLLILVPYGTYYLLFEAAREQYALLITSILFWIFGYWGVIGPLLAAYKVRTVFRAIELAQSQDKLVAALQHAETRDVAIDLIATENHIPRFLAARVYRHWANRLAADKEHIKRQ